MPMVKHRLLFSMRMEKPVKVTAVVVSSQHSADVSLEALRKDIIDKVG